LARQRYDIAREKLMRLHMGLLAMVLWRGLKFSGFRTLLPFIIPVIVKDRVLIE
jgi:hypothetical protein